jgi:hypothetical protein
LDIFTLKTTFAHFSPGITRFVRILLFVALAQPATAQPLPTDRHMEQAVGNGTRSIHGVPGDIQSISANINVQPICSGYSVLKEIRPFPERFQTSKLNVFLSLKVIISVH